MDEICCWTGQGVFKNKEPRAYLGIVSEQVGGGQDH